MRRAPPAKQEEPSLDGALSLAKRIAATAEKVDLYARESKRPPRALTLELKREEKKLDTMVKTLVKERRAGRHEIFSHPDITEETATELEWSYHKAISFTKDSAGTPSRIFAIPFLFKAGKDGKKQGVIEPSARARSTMENFIKAFASSRWSEAGDGQLSICLASKPLYSWIALAMDDQRIAEMHEALLAGKWRAWDQASQSTEKLQALGGEPKEGWFSAMWPFALQHPNEKALEDLDFQVFRDEFKEQFEEIFDPASEKDYFAPVDPLLMGNEGVKRLWVKHLETAVAEADAAGPSALKMLEVTFLWSEEVFVGVEVELQALGDNEAENPIYRKRIRREALIGESPESFGGWIMGFDPIKRLDYKVLLGHDIADPE